MVSSVVLVNKVDMVSAEDLGILKGLIARINTGATIYETNHSNIEVRCGGVMIWWTCGRSEVCLVDSRHDLR